LPQRKFVLTSPVRAIEELARNTYRLSIYAPEIARTCRPGNFINVLVPHCEEIYWRRPFSIHQKNSQEGTIDIFFVAVGRGTNALKDLQPGNFLDVIGPLGNRFDYPSTMKEAIAVAGGSGIAAFQFLLQDLKSWSGQKTLFYGSKSAQNFCCLEEFRELGAELHLSTEDGSKGEKGLVTDALESYLKTNDNNKGRELFVCGPTPMLKKVQEMTQQIGISAQVSVENKMACGFGACMGCPVTIAHPQPGGKKYWLACKDGPVFPINEILLDD
jgi:dihydroorotate dehydrogenase electron transfer subunit